MRTSGRRPYEYPWTTRPGPVAELVRVTPCLGGPGPRASDTPSPWPTWMDGNWDSSCSAWPHPISTCSLTEAAQSPFLIVAPIHFVFNPTDWHSRFVNFQPGKKAFWESLRNHPGFTMESLGTASGLLPGKDRCLESTHLQPHPTARGRPWLSNDGQFHHLIGHWIGLTAFLGRSWFGWSTEKSLNYGHVDDGIWWLLRHSLLCLRMTPYSSVSECFRVGSYQ